MFRQRFATTQEEVYPNANKYWTIWSFWGQTVSPARAIYEAMNPEKVSTCFEKGVLKLTALDGNRVARVSTLDGSLCCILWVGSLRSFSFHFFTSEFGMPTSSLQSSFGSTVSSDLETISCLFSLFLWC